MNSELLTKREAIAVQFALQTIKLGGCANPIKYAVREADLLLAELESSKPATDAEFDEALTLLKDWQSKLPQIPVYQKAISVIERCKRDMSVRRSEGQRREN